MIIAIFGGFRIFPSFMVITDDMGHIMRKPVFPYVNNKGEDQAVWMHRLICTFVVRCLDSIISLVSISKIQDSS